jgi:hypothetical protein
MRKRWAVIGSYWQTTNYVTGRGEHVSAIVTEYKGVAGLAYKVEQKALHNTYTDKDTAIRICQSAKQNWKDGPVSVCVKQVSVVSILKARKTALTNELRAINAELNQ